MALAVKICFWVLTLVSRLLAMCGLATVIKGASYTNIVPHSSFGANYFFPFPLPVNTDIIYVDYQCPEDIFEIMQETGSQFNYVYPRIPVKSKLNIQRWKHYLQGYPIILCSYISWSLGSLSVFLGVIISSLSLTTINRLKTILRMWTTI